MILIIKIHILYHHYFVSTSYIRWNFVAFYKTTYNIRSILSQSDIVFVYSKRFHKSNNSWIGNVFSHSCYWHSIQESKTIFCSEQTSFWCEQTCLTTFALRYKSPATLYIGLPHIFHIKTYTQTKSVKDESIYNFNIIKNRRLFAQESNQTIHSESNMSVVHLYPRPKSCIKRRFLRSNANKNGEIRKIEHKRKGKYCRGYAKVTKRNVSILSALFGRRTKAIWRQMGAPRTKGARHIRKLTAPFYLFILVLLAFSNRKTCRMGCLGS